MLHFGIATLVSELGDLYIIVRIVIDPVVLGWATRRRRQFCVGMLREQGRLQTFACGPEGLLSVCVSCVKHVVWLH